MRWGMLLAGMMISGCSGTNGPNSCPAAPTDHPVCPIGHPPCPVTAEWIPSCADGRCYDCQGSNWSLAYADCFCPDAGAPDAH